MFTLVDAARLLVAVLMGGIVIGLPGVALARAFRLPPRHAIIVGLAVLPLVDSLLARSFGLEPSVMATLALAACGAGLLFANLKTSNRITIAWQPIVLCAVWLALVIFESVDLDVAGFLYMPHTVVDTVKHAATTQAIVDSGAPPLDPFFLRPQRVSYYYFFYMLPALVERLGFGVIDARVAFGGCVFWVGLGLYALVRLALERAGFPAQAAGRRMLLVALLAAGGLDILGVLRIGLLQGIWLADPIIWNEQVSNWFESVLWVPHHVTGLMAAMLGLMTVASLSAPGLTRPDRARCVGLAALCFAATLGLSVWLALVLVATAGAWGLVLLAEKRWFALRGLALVGLLALILASPQIADLVAGRAGNTPAAIALTIRAFTPLDALLAPGPARMAARLVALPLNYFAGFGVFASGAILYWRTRDRDVPAPEFARLLMLAAIVGLGLGAFFKSTLFNNDLGWRVLLFPLLAGIVWTVAAVERLRSAPVPLQSVQGQSILRRVPRFLLILLGLGWATTAYAVVSLRFYPWFAREPGAKFLAADPATERGLRVAYGWADSHLPSNAVLQHNPTRPRAFAFAIYGRHRAAVADQFGSLFGADPALVDARIDTLGPIFTEALPPSQVRSRARAEGVDDLVVTAADPIWHKRDSFVWRAAPAYAAERVRIIPVAALADVPDDPLSAHNSAAALATRGD